jgi:hypothetical protein
MSEIEWGTGDDFSSGNRYCKQDGWYHVMIDKCSIPGRKDDGNIIDGSIGKFNCVVLGGTNASQREKECGILFFQPNLSHKDQGKFSREKFDRFLLATGVIKPDQKGITVMISEGLFIGAQLVIHWKSRLDKDKKEQWDVDGKSYFHVDDPEVAHVPKFVEALKHIQPARRWAPATQSKPIIPPPPPAAAESDDAGI